MQISQFLFSITNFRISAWQESDQHKPIESIPFIICLQSNKHLLSFVTTKKVRILYSSIWSHLIWPQNSLENLASAGWIPNEEIAPILLKNLKKAILPKGKQKNIICFLRLYSPDLDFIERTSIFCVDTMSLKKLKQTIAV